jgi:hypothetical protein
MSTDHGDWAEANANAPYDAAHQALRKGWVVLKSVYVRGDGFQAPGAVTLCKIDNPLHPYVIHFFNMQDGGFHSGNYCKTRAEAEEAFGKRALRFNVEDEPVDTDGDTSRWNENGEASEADNDRYASRAYRD